jgi:hypothetical protein
MRAGMMVAGDGTGRNEGHPGYAVSLAMMSTAACYDPSTRTYTVRHIDDRAVWQRFLLCRLLSARADGTEQDEREDTAWTRVSHPDGVFRYFNSFSQITVQEPPRHTPAADWLPQFYSALGVASFSPVCVSDSTHFATQSVAALSYLGGVCVQELTKMGVVNAGDLDKVTMTMLITAGMSKIQCKRVMRALTEMGIENEAAAPTPRPVRKPWGRLTAIAKAVPSKPEVHPVHAAARAQRQDERSHKERPLQRVADLGPEQKKPARKMVLVDALVQVQGKGSFVPMRLTLTGARLCFGDGRSAEVAGCTTRPPKSTRRCHPHAFRLDLSHADSHGDSKYIIDPGTAIVQQEWMRVLTEAKSVTGNTSNRDSAMRVVAKNGSGTRSARFEGDREAAATHVQSVYRGHRGRKRAKRKRLQTMGSRDLSASLGYPMSLSQLAGDSTMVGTGGRRRLRSVSCAIRVVAKNGSGTRSTRFEGDREAAATRIQSVYRGHHGRKRAKRKRLQTMGSRDLSASLGYPMSLSQLV